MFTKGIVLAVAVAAGNANAALIYIDFDTGGSRPTNFNTVGRNQTVTNLIDINGTATAIDITVPNNGVRDTSFATVSPTGDAAVFGSAMTDALYGQVSGLESSSFTIVIGDLDPTKTYDFVGSAYVSASDNRNTSYTFTGANSGSDTLNPVGNTSEVFEVAGIIPNANNQILLKVTGATGNNSGSSSQRYYYLGAMSIEAVPEPTTMAFAGLAGITLLARRRRTREFESM